MDNAMIAAVCHDANTAYCRAIGDFSHVPWTMTTNEQRLSALSGVAYRRAHPDASAADQHQAWYDEKLAQGWAYGPEKDVARKLHPCLVPYADLPPEQQVKDRLFMAIVDVLTGAETRST